MVSLLTLVLTLAAPAPFEPFCSSPEPGQKQGANTSTSTKALQFAPQGHRGPTDEEKEQNRIRLGITRQQQQQIDDLYNETRTKMGDVWKAMREAQNKLRLAYEPYDFNEGEAKSLRIEIVKLHRKMGEIQLDNERKIRAILTREQFGKLRELMKEQFQKFEERRRANRPPGAPGGPGFGRS
jgi:Spy/CpxP family protein refolding chaperone